MKSTYIFLILLISMMNFTTSCGTHPNPNRTYFGFERTLWKFTPEYYLLRHEFRDEIAFIKRIMKNPEKLQEIVETSIYYDKELLDINGRGSNEHQYQIIHGYFESNAKIVNFGYVDLLIHKNKQEYSDCKVIIVGVSHYFINFYFKEIHKKNVLLYIGVVVNHFSFD